MCDKEKEKDMNAIVKQRPVESAEVNFKSDKEYKDFVKLVNNPPEPNERVKNLIKQYQSQRENPGWKK